METPHPRLALPFTSTLSTTFLTKYKHGTEKKVKNNIDQSICKQKATLHLLHWRSTWTQACLGGSSLGQSKLSII